MSRHPIPNSGRALARATALVLMAAAVAALAGCGSRLLSRRARPEPVAAPAARSKPAGATSRPSGAKRTHARPPALADAGGGAPDPRDAMRRLERLVDADSLERAEAELAPMLARDPHDGAALALLSKIWFREGRHAQAIDRLAVVRSDPGAYSDGSRAALLAGLALHEDALGQVAQARATLAEAKDAGLPSSGSAAVYVTLRGEAPEAAADPARDAMHHDGHSAVNQNNYGITRLRAADPDGARKAFMSAIDRDPSLPGPYYNLAILEKFYRFDDAAATRWFREYWTRSQADPDSLFGVFSAAAGHDVAQRGN